MEFNNWKEAAETLQVWRDALVDYILFNGESSHVTRFAAASYDSDVFMNILPQERRSIALTILMDMVKAWTFIHIDVSHYEKLVKLIENIL